MAGVENMLFRLSEILKMSTTSSRQYDGGGGAEVKGFFVIPVPPSLILNTPNINTWYMVYLLRAGCGSDLSLLGRHYVSCMPVDTSVTGTLQEGPANRAMNLALSAFKGKRRKLAEATTLFLLAFYFDTSEPALLDFSTSRS